MKNFIEEYAGHAMSHRRKRVIRSVLLSIMSVLLVVLLLFSPLVNAQDQEKTAYCGITEHVHDDSCVTKTLICGNEETIHEHTDDCYETALALSCTVEEHSHNESCYNEGELICSENEHTHTDYCYKDEKQLICSAEQNTHIHTDECYITAYTCGVTAEHTHTEECFVNPEESEEEEAVSTEPKTKKAKAKAADETLPQGYEVETNRISPSSTVITMFDYRVGNNWNENKVNNITGNINGGHYLKFGGDACRGNLKYINPNKYTGSRSVYQGIVADNLVDGMPVLSGDLFRDPYIYASGLSGAYQNGGNNNTESLNYLFDNNENDYKRVYKNCKNLLYIDKDGYYAYNSAENYAYLDTNNNNTFVVYNLPAATGNFFPYNTLNTAYNLNTVVTEALNHFFGMNITARFIQQNSGFADPQHKKPVKFEFSGDDDVWIFIDDILVADLGGIHGMTSVSIDFSLGEVEISSVATYDKTNQTSFGTPDAKVKTYFRDIFSGTDV